MRLAELGEIVEPGRAAPLVNLRLWHEDDDHVVDVDPLKLLVLSASALANHDRTALACDDAASVDLGLDAMPVEPSRAGIDERATEVFEAISRRR